MSDNAYTYKTNNASSIGSTNPNDPFAALGAPLGGLILQPRKSTFTSTTLGTTEKIYTGVLSDVSSLALWVANKNYSYKINEERGTNNFSITVSVPYDEIANTDNLVRERVQWEIIPREVNRDIFDAGIFTTDNTGYLNTNNRYTVPPIVRAAIKEALKYGAFGSLNFGNIAGTNLTKNQQLALAPLYTISTQFLTFLKAGVTSVKAATIHVRRTAVYSTQDPNAHDSNPYFTQILPTSPALVANINPIISRQDLIGYFQPDAVTQAQLLPSYLVAKSLQGTPWNDTMTSYALGGYMCHVPIRTFITPTKVKIEQLFEFDEWLDALYTRFSPIGNFPLVSITPYPPGYTGFPNT